MEGVCFFILYIFVIHRKKDSNFFSDINLSFYAACLFSPDFLLLISKEGFDLMNFIQFQTIHYFFLFKLQALHESQ